MIQINQLDYSYPNGRVPALQKIDWRVEKGEFVLVAGASGSGKSTLLRCLNGLVPHFSGGQISGSVAVNGLDAIAQGPAALSRHVGFVLQNPEGQMILDRVEAEIAYGLENAAMPPQEMETRVEEVLRLLGLSKLRQRPLTTLSGGERQKVAIAAALAFRPQILALDEPTSQLDPQSAREVMQSLAHLQATLGLTIILAEHRLERTLRYVDKVVWMENGRLRVNAPTRTALLDIPHLPPLQQLARARDWRPLPLTIAEGKKFLDKDAPIAPNSAPEKEFNNAALLLEAKNIQYAYDTTPALNGVDLKIRAGEAIALLGRNGSGKSTLLKCLIGLLKMKEGEVWINGRSIQNRETADICLEAAYLPQNPDDLLFADSVAEELQITLQNHELQDQNGIQKMLKELGLAAFKNAYPRDLSVGQRQRVALGAVTITKPNLLLLDEPTRGLDYAAKQTLLAIWRRWLARGMGLLLATHDVELAAMIADTTLILDQGRVVTAGKTAVVLNNSPLFAPQLTRLFKG